MNVRSLRFRLVAWYAGILALVLVLLGTVSYFAMEQFLEDRMRDSQVRRERQVEVELNTAGRTDAEHNTELEARFAPGVNSRFIRITRANGQVMYVSSPPKDGSFNPQAVPPTPLLTNRGTEAYRLEKISGDGKLLIGSLRHTNLSGEQFVIESGTSTEPMENILRQFLRFLLLTLPVVLAAAAIGGSMLVKRALVPVTEAARGAERITFHNLSERLAITTTGDELEELTRSLNSMISRLDDAFQHSRRFVADASHELRTPLTILRGELEELAQRDDLRHDVRARLGSTLEEVERLTHIVEGLLALSRLDAGEAQSEWVRFDFAELAATTADQMLLLAEDKQITVRLAASQPVIVEGDRARLKQVVVNLLDNAIKYTPSGGAVIIKVVAAPPFARLEVEDNGIGIPPEAMAHLFERFFRVDKARSRELGGTGLGLSIVKSIVNAHGGGVSAASTPGRGSCFVVTLPLPSPKAPESDVIASKPYAPNTANASPAPVDHNV